MATRSRNRRTSPKKTKAPAKKRVTDVETAAQKVEKFRETLSNGDDVSAIALLDELPTTRGMLAWRSLSRLEQSPLHLAAAFGRLVVIDELLRRGADPDVLDSEGMPPLHWALAPRRRGTSRGGTPSEHRAVVDRLIAAGANVDRFTPRGHALHWACAAPCLDLARALLVPGVPVDLRVPDDATTPLHHGAAHRTVVDWLLSAGASPNPAGATNSPLGVAFAADAMDCVTALLAAGARFERSEQGEMVTSASERGAKLLELVLRSGASIDALDGYGRAAIHAAVGDLDVARVTLLLEHGADPNVQSSEGQTALDVLAEHDEDDEDVASLHALLQRAAAVRGAGDAAESSEPTLYQRFSEVDFSEREKAVLEADLPADAETLEYVVHHGASSLVRHFIERGAPVASLSSDAVFEIARLGETDKLAALLEAGVDPNLRFGGEPLIHGAVDFHLHDESELRVKLLLDRGVPVDDENDLGWTPLLRAAANGSCSDFGRAAPLDGRVVPGAIDVLVRAGARLDSVSRAGTTVLHAACAGGLTELARAARDAGCDADAANHFLRRPLHEAARGGHIELVRWLCELGVDRAPRDVEASTPVHLAVRALKGDAAIYLVDAGAPVDTPDAAGQTPLAIACEVGLHSLVPKLLAAGANPNSRDVLHRTPLHRACESSTMHHMSYLLAFTPSDEIRRVEGDAADVGVQGARLLLDAGADIGAADLEGRTPLHVAASQRMLMGGDVSAAMCKMLVAAGASPKARDLEGKTPLELAASRSIIGYLRGL